jgi:purine catabolism regulator
MGNLAKDQPEGGPDLPAPPVVASTGTLTYGLTVREVLGASSLAGSRLVAGAAGLDRVVQRLNVMEVPDILPWVKPHELLLTTGYPLRNAPQTLADLVDELDDRGLAAIAIKLGRYIDELPAQMLAAADRLGFPIVMLPKEVAFDDILNQVLTDVLNRQAAVLARSEEVHRALVQVVLAGGGLREVTDELFGLLGGAVLVTGPDGHVLAESGGDDLAQVRAASCFDPGGRFRARTESYGVSGHEGLVGQHAIVPIVAGRVDHGRIVAFGAQRRLTESDVHTLERAATVAALAITKQHAVHAVESKYQADFMHDLLAGRAGDREHVVAHAASLGWDVDRPLVVVVAEPDKAGRADHAERGERGERGELDRLAAAWASALRPRDLRAAAVGLRREVVALVGAPRHGDVGRLVRELAAAVASDPGGPRRPFSTGISRVVTDPEELPKAYDQAGRAVHVARQLDGPGAVADFDALGALRLLSLIPDAGELRAFARDILGELADRDDAHAADLRRTLEVLLEANLNVAEAARLLHFHYNTLRYRITKLERLVGPFTQDPHLRLDLALALTVLRMRGLD